MRRQQCFSHHRLLLVSILIIVGVVVAACATITPPAPAQEEPSQPSSVATEQPAAEAESPAEEIVLDIRASQPEYLNAERQIWDIYEAQNPGVKVNLFAVNEDQVAAFEAKMAGGYVPAMDLHGAAVDAGNYQNYVNLLDVDFEWFDRWQYDVRTAAEELTGVPGVYALDPFLGRFFTWQYHADLMEELGLDPREIQTQADLKQFLADCTAAVAERDDIDFCWDQGWHNWVWGGNYFGMWPLSHADGQRDRQRDSFLGQIEDPAEDPFRHSFEWIKEAYQSGWMPEEFWLREWETDMETSFIARKSLMMLHGPWTWDKMLAADPSAQQLGIPSTPPEKEGDPWVQSMGPVNLNRGYRIPIGNMDKPEWSQVLDAFNWWYSPEVVKMQAEIKGVGVLYDLDEPLELEGPQWLGIIKEFQPGGLYEDVIIETSPTGDTAVTKYKVEGSGNFWDWQWNDVWAKVVQDEMTVDEALAWFHEQMANDYDLP
ncbi:MAG: ABC transporter substrate-binding protein [Chloroflexota bacterium]|nr:ABC transporter substrate-binding protein [Chloroflexota bacterium]